MRRWLRRLRHRLAHRLGWNRGNPETWWSGGRLFVAFHCYGCGRFLHAEDITDRVSLGARSDGGDG